MSLFNSLAIIDQWLIDRSINHRLINIISKLGTTHFAPSTEKAGTAPPLIASPFPTSGSTLVGDSKMNESTLAGQSPESHLKRQSLECLVAVLRSLVSWSARGTSNVAPTTPAERTRNESISLPSLAEGLSSEDRSEQDLNAAMLAFNGHSSTRSGSATPDISMAMSPNEDAPSRFENAKQMKTTLLEGIRKFNFKPKRVRSTFLLLPGMASLYVPWYNRVFRS